VRPSQLAPAAVEGDHDQADAGPVDEPAERPVGAENSSTSCDLGIFVDQPAESIDP